MKLACLQICTGMDPERNARQMQRDIERAVSGGAELIALPESCNFMARGRAGLMERLCEEADDPMVRLLREAAARHSVYILAGSVLIASDDGRAANRSLVMSPTGDIVARYDKIHLFDVTLENGESHHESAHYRAGNTRKTVDLPAGRLGLSICYDVRFAYLYRALAHDGAQFISVPSAFTKPTGAAHWHVLLRARAIETGCFIFAPAQFGTHENGRQTYGHSLIINPWGEIIAETQNHPNIDEAEIIYGQLDVGAVDRARRQIPALQHDRREIALPS